MRSLLIGMFSMLLFVSVSEASSNNVLGFIINYDCPHCKKAFSSVNSLKTQCGGGIETSLCELRLMPFPNEVADFRPTAFYAINSKSPELAEKVSSVFFEYNPKGSLDQDEVMTLLSTLLPSYKWSKYLNHKTILEGKDALKRAAKLFKTLKVSDYPTFLWVNKNEAKVIPTVHNPSKRIDSVITFLGRQK